MEFKDYWRILRNHWLGALCCVIATALLALSWSLAQPKVYAAVSTGFVTTGTVGDAGLESLGDSLAKSRVKSYVVLATDRTTSQMVASRLGLTDSPSQLAGRIDIEQPPDTVNLQITATGPTPQEAQALADTWVQALADRVHQVENRGGSKQESTISIEPSASAELPTAPISPQPLRNALIGALLGAILGTAYATGRNQLDRRIRSSEQITRLGTSTVASIPEIAGVGRNLGIVATGRAQEKSTQAAEGFRKLRTNISYLDVDNPPRIIVVTSPSQGDGKSSVAANLSAVIAVSGQPVTLIDGDLRRPRVAKALDLPGEVGLTDVLAARVSLDDALQQHPTLTTLRVLPAGDRPPNPSELLGSKAMRKLLRALSRTSMVIVDAPPLLPVTDAAVLTRASDGALVVVSAGRTLDTHLEAALDNLTNVQGRVLGVVLNRVTRRRTTSDYYKQQYYYRYDEDRSRSRGRRARTEAG